MVTVKYFQVNYLKKDTNIIVNLEKKYTLTGNLKRM